MRENRRRSSSRFRSGCRQSPWLCHHPRNPRIFSCCARTPPASSPAQRCRYRPPRRRGRGMGAPLLADQGCSGSPWQAATCPRSSGAAGAARLRGCRRLALPSPGLSPIQTGYQIMMSLLLYGISLAYQTLGKPEIFRHPAEVLPTTGGHPRMILSRRASPIT